MVRIAAGEMSNSLRAQIEPTFALLFEPETGLDDLSISGVCAHILLESVKALKAKKDENSVLSTTTIFLTTMLIARKYANERRPSEGVPGSELERLEAWGGALRGDFSQQLDALVEDFFSEYPTPDTEMFEDLPTPQEVTGLKFGPGLKRVLADLANLRVVRITDIVLKSADEPVTGLAERISTNQLHSLIDALKRVGKTSAGRATEMSREAEDDELALKIDDFAKALATILRTAKGEFTFALFGPWGSGKTTLTRLVRKLLQSPADYRKATSADNESFSRSKYDVVYHNAWKYRTPPEAWIYLYKSLAERAGSDLSAVGRFMLAVRTSHMRSGLWPIVGVLMALALMAIPMGATVQLAAISGSLIGVGALAHLAAISPKVQTKVRELFRKHARLTSSNENLGMLALVGEDIRSLLTSWTVPLDKGFPIPIRQLFLPVVILVCIGGAWAYGLLSQPEQARDGVLVAVVKMLSNVLDWAGVGGEDNLKRGPLKASDWIFFSVWCVLSAAMTVVPWIWSANKAPNRVLLVVDDLDRCRPDEMLDVIENMKLLVDDPTLSDRLQVMMLVDEKVLGHAIAERYRPMIEDRSAEVVNEPHSRVNAREEIITEQKEKLFACHLRVASLQDSDVAAVVSKLASLDLEPVRQRKREAERVLREEQIKAEKEAAEKARAKALRADEAYRKILNGDFAEESLIDVDGPSDKQPSMRGRRPGWEDALVPPTEAEKRRRIERNEGIKARNAAKRAENKLTAEERLARNPDVLRDREALNAESERLQRRIAEIERISSEHTDNDNIPPFTKSDVRFTSDEVDELERFTPQYFRSINRSPSPRAIRLLLFKIQLCRLLMHMRLHARTNDSFSIKKILDAFVTASSLSHNNTADIEKPTATYNEVVTIAKQVI